ncbi:nucleotidyltransferase family protein [Methylobacterium oryzihabitans]
MVAGVKGVAVIHELRPRVAGRSGSVSAAAGEVRIIAPCPVTTSSPGSSGPKPPCGGPASRTSLFGSCARGEAREGSDVDVFVGLEPTSLTRRAGG